MSATTKFNPVTATAAHLQQLLESHDLTSVEIVETYLEQIEKHNTDGLKLRALISVAPKETALSIAKRLDDERKDGNIRGPLHGLPIIVKDAIMTGPELGMDSTAGSYVFADTKTKKNATVIDQLVDNGLIVLGKANLSEFCGLKDKARTPGWSAKGRQTRSIYRRPGLEDKDQPTCGGSSAGSGVGVSAGFAPLALGTDTSGSNVYPASVAGLYGLNPTTGSVSSDGVFRLSRAFDCVGAMAKTPADLAALVDCIVTPEAREELQSHKSRQASNHGWSDMSIAFSELTWGRVDADKWTAPMVKSRYEEAVNKIRELGARVVYPANLPDSNTLVRLNSKKHKNDIEAIAFHEFSSVLEEFITGFADPKVGTLADLVQWNEANAATAMPEPYTDQDDLIKALHDSTSDTECSAAATALKILACDNIDAFMDEHGAEIIAAPSDSTLVSWSAFSGYPIATVPLGNLEKNGQPFGLFLLARAKRENLLLRFMSLFEEAGVSICKGPEVEM